MRTAQGGAAGAIIRHHLTSAHGTKREFSPERLKGRKPPHCRRSRVYVGLSTVTSSATSQINAIECWSLRAGGEGHAHMAPTNAPVSTAAV